jgi:hypothetical protein
VGNGNVIGSNYAFPEVGAIRDQLTEPCPPARNPENFLRKGMGDFQIWPLEALLNILIRAD